MADFKALDPQSVAWAASWHRGQPAARVREGDGGPATAKLLVQTPVAPCRVSLVGSGMYRVDMAFGGPRPPRVHSDFCDWVCEVDEAAATACRADAALADWSRGKSQSTSLFRAGMRVTAFSDTLCFDRDGTLSFDLMDAQCCSCLLELQGCWSTDARWGVRWKVMQVKFDTEPWTQPAAAQSAAAQSAAPEPAAQPAAFAFLDD